MPIFNDKESRKGNRDCCDILGEGKNTNATFFLATKGGRWWWKPLTSVEYKQALLFSLLPDALLNCINYFFCFCQSWIKLEWPKSSLQNSNFVKILEPILNFWPSELLRFWFWPISKVEVWISVKINPSELFKFWFWPISKGEKLNFDQFWEVWDLNFGQKL